MKDCRCSNPAEIATSTRRKQLKKTYASKEWKNNVKEFISGKKCEWCGTKEKLLAHHPYLQSYSDGTYVDLYLSGCMVLCNRCHFALHKGLILCKRCGKKYHLVGADCCRDCFIAENPEITEKKNNRKILLSLKKKLYSEAKAVEKSWYKRGAQLLMPHSKKPSSNSRKNSTSNNPETLA